MHLHGKEHLVNDRRGRRIVPIATVLALTLVLTACGDSDEAATPTTVAAPAQATTTVAGSSEGDVAAYCDAELEAQAAFAAGGPEGPDPAQIQAAFAKARESAPEEIAADVERLIELFEESMASEEEVTVQPPEIDELDARIDDYVLANCNFAELAVTGREYKYEGLSEPVPAGETAVIFTNEGGEQHEIVLFRINDEVTMSAQELLALPEEQAISMVQVKAFAFADPGESDMTAADLEPGRYAAVCFFPVGSTPEAVAAAEESGQEIEAPPHFTQGMLAEFTVE